MGHPYLGGFGDGSEDASVVRGDVEHGSAEFGVVFFGDGCAEEFAGELHAVADAEDWDAEFEDFGVHGGGVVV